MSYLRRLKEHISETPPTDQPLKPLKPSSGGLGGNPRGRISEKQARATLRHWHSHLAPLDLHSPPDGFQPNRWAQLVEDSWWLYEAFGSQLAREGWDDLSAWGVLPWRDGGGVLLDRLQGARNLKLSGDGWAYWTSYGVTFSTCRGLGETLISSGLRLIWEKQR